MPMKFRISSQYGALEEIRDGRVHSGVDLAMPKGTELHSISEGTVDHIISNDRIGNGVFVRADNGDVHIYGHLDKITVKAGEHVNAGDLLGYSGSTGHSTGPHLHFGLIHDGQFSDPSGLISAVQHYSGNIAGPSILGVKGPATWVLERATGHVTDRIASGVKDRIFDLLGDVAGVIFDMSYSIALISCAALIMLGVVGLRDGYRWSGIVFGAYALVRLLAVGGVK